MLEVSNIFMKLMNEAVEKETRITISGEFSKSCFDNSIILESVDIKPDRIHLEGDYMTLTIEGTYEISYDETEELFTITHADGKYYLFM